MTKLVGILNVTPDSFSDGGKFDGIENALAQTQKLIKEGAQMIDIGAESTRPGAVPITAEQEIARIKDILPAVVAEVKSYDQEIEISIDSYHFETIKFAFEAGVDVINDVSGLKDEKIVDFIAKNNIKTILMHSLSVPADPKIIVNSALGVAEEVLGWAVAKIKELQVKGVQKSQLIFDPGIGFSKDNQQSIRILKNIDIYKVLEVPIYVGHSKKRFLDDVYKNLVENDDKEHIMEARALKTAMISAFLAQNGVDYLRVHDVSLNKEYIEKNIAEIDDF